jgi:hypothetical protein
MRPLAFSITLLLIAYVSAADQTAETVNKTIKGWLSDEQCARGRASSGVFTGTNPRCAKECVAKGRKIVLIDPEAKRILTIQNQSVAQRNIGDYVEVQGALNSTNSFHIDVLKKLSPGVAACERTEPVMR